MSHRRREGVYAYVSLIPALTVVGLFSIYPLVYALKLSVTKNVLTNPLDHGFVGLGNFSQVLGTYYFASSLMVTLTYTIAAVLLTVLFGLGAALLMDRPGKVPRMLRMLILLPWSIPIVMGGIMWRWIFNGNYGIFNAFLVEIGAVDQYLSWLAHPMLAIGALLTAHTWKEGPISAVMLLASLQVIPREVYEAARLDGANSWVLFRSITLPFLRPTLLIVIILQTLIAFVTFDLIYVMTGGGPADATSLLSWFAYAETFRSLDLGRGAALATVIAAIAALLATAYLWRMRSQSLYQAR